MDYQRMLVEVRRLNGLHKRTGNPDQELFYTVGPTDPERRCKFEEKLMMAMDISQCLDLVYEPRRNEELKIFEVVATYNPFREITQLSLKVYIPVY